MKSKNLPERFEIAHNCTFVKVQLNQDQVKNRGKLQIRVVLLKKAVSNFSIYKIANNVAMKLKVWL